jgi:hypothetical protein
MICVTGPDLLTARQGTLALLDGRSGALIVEPEAEGRGDRAAGARGVLGTTPHVASLHPGESVGRETPRAA